MPIYVYLGLIAASLLLPIMLSLPAIMKAIDISVREALSDCGILPDTTGATTEKVSAAWMPRGLLLAIRNSLRQKKRLAITVASMALGVAIFSAGFNVRASLAMLLEDIDNSAKHDVQVVLSDQIPRERAMSVFRAIENVSRIQTWIRRPYAHGQAGWSR